MKDNEDEYIDEEIVEEKNEEEDLQNTLWGSKKAENRISKVTNFMVIFISFVFPIPFGIFAGVYLLGRNEKEIRELGAACIQTSFIAMLVWLYLIIRLAIFIYYVLQGTIEFDLIYGEKTYNLIIDFSKLTLQIAIN